MKAEIEAMDQVRVMVALGKFGFDQLWRILKNQGQDLPSPRPQFGHGLEVVVRPDLTILASFHPSQQNTFTGKLTEWMFDQIWSRAAELLKEARRSGGPPGPL